MSLEVSLLSRPSRRFREDRTCEPECWIEMSLQARTPANLREGDSYLEATC